MASSQQGSHGNVKDKTESIGAGASKAVGEVKGKAQELAAGATQKAQDLAHKAQDAASDAAGKAKDIASNVSQKAHEAASGAADRTEEALSTVGEKMTSFASSLREKAPHEGTMGTAASMVADKLQAGGHYLQENGFKEMTDDLNALVRQHPMQSLLVGFGVGCLIGMSFSRR